MKKKPINILKLKNGSKIKLSEEQTKFIGCDHHVPPYLFSGMNFSSTQNGIVGLMNQSTKIENETR